MIKTAKFGNKMSHRVGVRKEPKKGHVLIEWLQIECGMFPWLNLTKCMEPNTEVFISENVSFVKVEKISHSKLMLK